MKPSAHPPSVLQDEALGKNLYTKIFALMSCWLSCHNLYRAAQPETIFESGEHFIPFGKLR